MIIVVKFDDNEAEYEVPMEKLIKMLKLNVTIEQIQEAVKEYIRRT
jgi:hypothetical protein